MARFYFDYRDEGALNTDDTGLDLPDVEAAKKYAAAALADLAKDVLPDGEPHNLGIEVRGADGTLLRLTMTVDVQQA